MTKKKTNLEKELFGFVLAQKLAKSPMPVLKLQCSDGKLFQVGHQEAMMSSTLWMLLQDIYEDKHKKDAQEEHIVPLLDIQSSIVQLALEYCRCLYEQQFESKEEPLRAWEEKFFDLNSRTLCELAKAASHLDIQPLVDLTCHSIAQIMSATEAAEEIRQKFGLEDPPSAECNCELRAALSGLDMDIFQSFDQESSTEEFEFVEEFDQPSVDELVRYINGEGDDQRAKLVNGSSSTGKSHTNPCSPSHHQCAHAPNSFTLDRSGSAISDNSQSKSAKKRSNKKKKRKQKKKQQLQQQQVATSGVADTAESTAPRSRVSNTDKKELRKVITKSSEDDENDEEDDVEDVDEFEEEEQQQQSSSERRGHVRCKADLLKQKVALAIQNPSAVFHESDFEEDDEHDHEEIESFRLALESVHMNSHAKKKRELPIATKELVKHYLRQSKPLHHQQLRQTRTPVR